LARDARDGDNIMEIIPAIDLKGGKCVRLRQGRDEATTDYSSDPVAVAREWVAQGARRLHVVNLDGAFGRQSGNLAVVKEIASAVDVAVQYGGGLRSRESIDSALEAGVARIVLGTAAMENRGLVEESLQAFGGERIIVALDAVGGKVATRGWTSVTDLDVVQAARELYAMGMDEVLYTDIGRDGMMTGPDLATLGELAEIGIGILASGGISSEGDVQALLSMKAPNLTGVIVGRALYEKAVTLSSLIALTGRR